MTGINGVSYVSKEDHETSPNGYAVGANHTGDVDTYTWTNRLVGQVYPMVNIYWKDDAKPTTQAARPDVYTTLYRSLDGGKTLEVVAGSDKDWSISEVNTSWSTVTYAAQPRFDASGREYTYYIGESFTAAAHEPYANTGNYDSQPSEDGKTFDDTGASYQPEGAKLPTGATVFPAPFHNDSGKGGTIVNKPQAKIAVTGNKEWMNLPAGFSRSDLTSATFKLRRYTPDKGENGQTEADATFVAADGTNAEREADAATTTLGANGRTFRFGGGEDGTEPIFDQYDPDGYRYTYIVTEKDPNTGGIVYDVSNNTETGLAVTNTYRDDQGLSIKFSKKWDLSRFVGEGSPSVPVTMTLVRYVTDAEGHAIEATRSDNFCTAGTNGAANAVTIDYKGVTAGDTTTLTWSHLAYYAPNGRKYQYRVEESDLPDTCYVVFTGADNNPVEVNPRPVAGRTVYESVVDLGDPPKKGDDGNIVTIERTSKLKNVYDDKGSLQVRKTWVDPQNAFDLVTRPTSITGTLTRTAAGTTQTLQADGTWKTSDSGAYKLTLTKDGTAEGQAVTVKPSTAGDANTITITNAGEATQDGKATWTATVEGLDCHDPNGNKYTYQFKEDELAGYDMDNGGVSNGVAAVKKDTLNVAQVTNTLKTTSIQAKKKWMGKSESSEVLKQEFGNDEVLFLNQLSAIPDSVTFDVEYKKAGSDTWTELTRQS